MELTQWAQWAPIVVIFVSVFAGIVAMLVLAVLLEQWMAAREPSEVTALPLVRDRDELEDEGAA